MPRLVEEVYPDSTVEVIEIDPEVTEVAHQYLELRRDTSIITYNIDARMKMPELTGGRYDMIVGDAFNDFSVPYHLTTLEFNERVKEVLKPESTEGGRGVSVLEWQGGAPVNLG